MLLKQISSSGKFEIRLISFTNDEGRTVNGKCCGRQHLNLNNETQSISCMHPSNGLSCHTYFKICLSHYQANISVNGTCTTGQKETSTLGRNSFELDSVENDELIDTTTESVIRFEFSFTWPVCVDL